MISRSRRAPTPEERDHDRRSAFESFEEPPSPKAEPARTEHDPVPDTVDLDGVPYHVDRCAKCGIWEPRSDGVCPGWNHQLDEFANGEESRQ